MSSRRVLPASKASTSCLPLRGRKGQSLEYITSETTHPLHTQQAIWESPEGEQTDLGQF